MIVFSFYLYIGNTAQEGFMGLNVKYVYVKCLFFTLESYLVYLFSNII